jgi:hypothetical protein
MPLPVSCLAHRAWAPIALVRSLMVPRSASSPNWAAPLGALPAIRTAPSTVTEVTPAIRFSRVRAELGTVALNPEISGRRRPIRPPARVTSRSASAWAAGSVRTITATGRPAGAGLATAAAASSTPTTTTSTTAASSRTALALPLLPSCKLLSSWRRSRICS